MKLRVHNLKLPLDTEEKEIKAAALSFVRAKETDCISFRIAKQSIDARKKEVSFVYSVDLEVTKRVKTDGKYIIELLETEPEEIVFGTKQLSHRPVVVGSGPCGLFCAYRLAEQGYQPILLERGADVDTRTQKVDKFWKTASFSPQTNVQFGEGGAGTFSDGKLTTRLSDPKIKGILETFVRFGAPEEIGYKAKPHIGTDVLKTVVKNIRNKIIALGGEVRFQSQVADVEIKQDRIKSVKLATGEEIPCDVLVLAIGHSARDTYEMLYHKGLAMQVKSFSVGARVEHLQSFINEAMYGDYAGHPRLGAADYQLSYRNEDDACYSFCMCPGGVVVAAASEEHTVVTNGMSYFSRAERNANAALCVNVTPKDFESEHPLSGVLYQREMERRAFVLGGKNYCAPAQKTTDFLDSKKSGAFAEVLPSYQPGVLNEDLNKVFSERVSRVLKDGLRYFDRKIQNFTKNAVLTGVETRTSAPLRILRNEAMECMNVHGIYPAGEGAGYAGGIMSAALDGIKIAEKIMSVYQPVE
ncbi:MAG: NAD(P)-binding protein [Clostridia bacterium]|nr:NAD(P)-binding protein [Clostridia bacterium]